MFAARTISSRVASAASRELASSNILPTARLQAHSSRFLSSVVVRPTAITQAERAALRAARRERARIVKNAADGKVAAEGGAGAGTGGSRIESKYLWYAALGVPSGLLLWGLSDENSPPAQLATLIGFTALVERYTEEFARPAHKKLLPDWSQVCLSFFSFHHPSIFFFMMNSLFSPVVLFF